MHASCQNVRLLGSLMMDDRRERLPRLQPALFDASRLAPLSSSAQKSLVRLNQQQRRSLPLPRLLPSGEANGVPAICSRELPGAVHSSLLLNRSRVELEGIRRQSSEDTAARAVKAKLCFCPFQMATFSIWGGRFSRFHPLDTENGQGSCPKVCSCQSLKLLPQTFNFVLGTELAPPTEMLQFYGMLKNESTFGDKFWYSRK